jgi:hypothetical protein
METKMTLNYEKVWEKMNSLESVTTRVCSAREILESAIDALENHKYAKAEALMYAANEFLEYYLNDFDEKFKGAWKETVVKIKQEEHSYLANDFLTQDRISNFPGEQESLQFNTVTGASVPSDWSDYWEDYDGGSYRAYENFNQFGVVRGGESEDVITFGTSDDDCMPPWGHSDLEYAMKHSKDDKVVKWQLPVEMDDETGEYIIQFPDDLLESAGLKENDTVEWVDNGDGSYLLTKPKEVVEF